MSTLAAQDLLRVSDLRKSYFDIPVLKDVGFILRPGEAAAVVGPNGAGKTTLLKCVAGSEDFDEGSIELDGSPLRESDPAVRAAMACLLDDVDYFPDLSVVDHLSLYAWAHGTADPPKTVDALLDELNLSGAADQLPATLSSGQRHRLGLASCLVRPRRLLLLDEPEQRLDAKGRAWLASRLNSEKAAGVGILFSSHDRELIDATADWTIEVAT
ncbi:ABC transporter ATP-binding protein [Actinomadura geliboluensis]|uniref:ABC transporter ATP-binding protein n=1 Tax=Actinomadura geliboluensis TaxID=882440 RepID=A0A5S4G4E9_9ACTN|nr:ABC transporter ATP-binding protein [Actinomadura geliboluensis]TMR27722.1 ABC transporter ATP-binding protein [Actinomadura geliboluensis]CNF13598.1 ABC transporter-like protein [Mycobacterium tuberculosis]